jgi:hypothetical protein
MKENVKISFFHETNDLPLKYLLEKFADTKCLKGSGKL